MSTFAFCFFMFFPVLLLVGCFALAEDWKIVGFLRDKMSVGSPNRVSWYKLYTSALFIVITIMHVAINTMWPWSYGIMISTALLIYIANYSRAVGLMKILTNRKPAMVFFMTLILALTIAAYYNIDFLSTAMTLAFILLWSFIFPDVKYQKAKKKILANNLARKVEEECGKVPLKTSTDTTEEFAEEEK